MTAHAESPDLQPPVMLDQSARSLPMSLPTSVVVPLTTASARLVTSPPSSVASTRTLMAPSMPFVALAKWSAAARLCVV